MLAMIGIDDDDDVVVVFLLLEECVRVTMGVLLDYGCRSLQGLGNCRV